MEGRNEEGFTQIQDLTDAELNEVLKNPEGYNREMLDIVRKERTRRVIAKAARSTSSPQQAQGAQPPPRLQDADNQEYSAVIQKNTSYYLKAFQEFDAGITMTSWNWCACLFCYGWLAYRKMYAAAAILFCIDFMVSSFSADIWWLPPLIVSGGCGLTGNYLYWKKTKAVIYTSKAMQPQDQQRYLQERGGVNIIAGWVLGAGTSILSAMQVFFFGI